MWASEIILLATISHAVPKYRWHGWVHSSTAGRSPVGYDTHTIGLSTVIETAKTTLEICLKCRYYQDRSKRDLGPEAAIEHWYELLIKDKYCYFGRKVLVEFFSYPENATYAAHKTAFNVARDAAIFCTDSNRIGKKSLLLEVADLISLATFNKKVDRSA